MNKKTKRSYEELQPQATAKGTKKVKREIKIYENFISSDSLKTVLLTPDTPLDPEDIGPLFKKRIERQLAGDARLNIPEISLEEAREWLSIVLELLAEDKKNNDQVLAKSQHLSKKESKILEAADYLMQGCYTHTLIAKILGLKRSDIANPAKRIEKSGKILPISPGQPLKLKPQHLDFTQNLIQTTKGTDITLKSLKGQLVSSFPGLEDVAISAMQRNMANMGYTYKRAYKYPERRNVDDVKKERKTVVKKLVYSLLEDAEVIFVDETSVHLGLSRSYGWSKRGQRVISPTPPKSENYSVITAIGSSRVFGGQIVRGSALMEDYLGFLTEIIHKYALLNKDKEVVIFADNASVHKAKAVQNSLVSHVTLLFNAPHSPMLNPIEDYFAKFKNLLRKKSTKNERELVFAIQEVLSMVEAKELKAYVRHVLSFVEPSLNNQDII